MWQPENNASLGRNECVRTTLKSDSHMHKDLF